MKLKSVSLMIKRTAVILSVAVLITACCLYSKQNRPDQRHWAGNKS